MLNGEYAFIVSETNIIFGGNHLYRPEVKDEHIYEGVLGVGVKTPSGDDYQEFQRKVIDAFQDKRFHHLPHLSPTADVEEVHVYAGIGMFCPTC